MAKCNASDSTAHIRALDGLRSIAVLSVISYHFGVPGIRGGFLGVDLFFVLSGFLITRLLIAEHNRTGTISLRGFWSRRIRRLAPAIALMLLVVAAWGTATLDRFALRSLRDDMLATLAHVANWRFIGEGQSYFASYSDASPLRHMWSLAIEEQFYVVWPIVALGLFRICRGRRWPFVVMLLTLIAVSSSLMSALYENSDPSRAYYGTDTRMAQLAVGALLAVVLVGRDASRPISSTRLRSLTGFVTLVTMVGAFFLVEDGGVYMYKGGFLAFSALSAVLLWTVLTAHGSALDTMLSWRPAVLVGQISYGLYLWHWPVQTMITSEAIGIDGAGLAVVRVMVTVVAAIVSYLLIEQPVRRSQGWASSVNGNRGIAAFSVTTVLLIGVILGSTLRSESLPDYLDLPTAEVVDSGENVLNNPGDILDIVLIGDSLPQSLALSMERLSNARGASFASRAVPGCSMLRGLPLDGNGQHFKAGEPCVMLREGHLADTANVYTSRVVIWMDAWDVYDRRVDGADFIVGTNTWYSKMTQLVKETADVLLSKGAHLFIVSMSPVAPDNEMGHTDPTFDRRVGPFNDLLERYASAHPESVTFIDLAARLCPELPEKCSSVIDGVRPRPKDGVHFDGPGADWATRIILDAVDARFE